MDNKKDSDTNVTDNLSPETEKELRELIAEMKKALKVKREEATKKITSSQIINGL